MKPSQVLTLINKYRLVPVHRREVSLFTYSVFFNTYVRGDLKKVAGQLYPAMVVVGRGFSAWTFINEQYVARKIGVMVNGNRRQATALLRKAAQVLIQNNRRFTTVSKKYRTDPSAALNFFANHYYHSLFSLGVFNSFYRYVGEGENRKKLGPEIIKHISWGKQKTAQAYFEAEKLLKKVVGVLRKTADFDPDLLRYMSWNEMKTYAKTFKVAPSLLRELVKRRRGYVLVVYDNREIIFTDPKVSRMINTYYSERYQVSGRRIKGTTAYPGQVKGWVRNLTLRQPKPSKKPFVLVTNMTRPCDLTLIKKCRALITDEGGYLCHAAILAREFRIPCIVGTKMATQIFKNGDRVEVNADRETVKKI